MNCEVYIILAILLISSFGLLSGLSDMQTRRRLSEIEQAIIGTQEKGEEE